MLAMCNARGSELQRQGVPCEVVWQDAVVISDVWGVAKGSPNAKAAWRFIAFASQPERQAEFAKRLYYGPENPAAYQFLSPEIARQLPSAPANASVAAQYDAQWHATHYASLQERFTQWLSA
jgi:putative spermidine/putrescine transport system substrate-binding protein